MKRRSRCSWASVDASPEYLRYHDEEWGVPSHDDVHLFEMLTLEGAQAGLSWATILKKRDGYRAAFRGFDPTKVARLTEARQNRLLDDARIVRNRAKIASTVSNARAFIEVEREHGSFDAYLWAFVDGAPIQRKPRSSRDVPAKTELAERISNDLRARGFRFVGPTIIYAFMQAVGVVNDHLVTCFRHAEVAKLASRKKR
jgi:DNA-3-methyladenine glycosylase I